MPQGMRFWAWARSAGAAQRGSGKRLRGSSVVVGAMLLVLALYFFRTETQARQDRIKLTDELQNLVRESLDKTDIIEVKTDIAAINSKMTNLERELETMKDFVISGRIGGGRG